MANKNSLPQGQSYTERKYIFLTAECLYQGYANTGKKISISFINNFHGKKKQNSLFRVLIKRETLTIRELLYTNLVRVTSSHFAIKMLSETKNLFALSNGLL